MFASAPPTKKPLRERLAHVARAVAVLLDLGALDLLLVVREVGAVAAALQALVDRLGGEHARVHRVVDALERRHVHHAGAVADDRHARRPQLPRLRPVAARRDRLRAPADALAALDDLRDQRVRLQLLERVVHREARVAVVEPDHEAHRDLVLAHRVDERAAELAVLRGELERPAHRVDHAVERLLDLPDLLHAELPLLRVLGAEVEVADRRAGEVAGRALGEHRRLRDQVRAGLEVGELLAVAAAALVAGAHADHASVLHEQLVAGGLAAGCRRPPPRPAGRASGRAARPRSRGCRGCGTAAASASAGSPACRSA